MILALALANKPGRDIGGDISSGSIDRVFIWAWEKEQWSDCGRGGGGLC
jgi:hypothetical protein